MLVNASALTHPLPSPLAPTHADGDADMAELPVLPSTSQLGWCERIVRAAKALDLAHHSANRQMVNDNWFSRAAKEADILLDSDDESPRCGLLGKGVVAFVHVFVIA